MRVLLGGELFPERLDAIGDVGQLRRLVRLAVQDVEFLDRIFHVFVRDDVGVARVDLVAVRVVVMKMRIHDPADRLVGDHLQVFDEGPRGRRRRAGINDHHLAVADDDRVVAPGRQRTGGRGVVHALGDRLEFVGLAGNRRVR